MGSFWTRCLPILSRHREALKGEARWRLVFSIAFLDFFGIGIYPFSQNTYPFRGILRSIEKSLFSLLENPFINLEKPHHMPQVQVGQ